MAFGLSVAPGCGDGRSHRGPVLFETRGEGLDGAYAAGTGLSEPGVEIVTGCRRGSSQARQQLRTSAVKRRARLVTRAASCSCSTRIAAAAAWGDKAAMGCTRIQASCLGEGNGDAGPG